MVHSEPWQPVLYPEALIKASVYPSLIPQLFQLSGGSLENWLGAHSKIRAEGKTWFLFHHTAVSSIILQSPHAVEGGSRLTLSGSKLPSQWFM